ncbi:hypothetical protein SAMN02910298_02655 [Pseudobutyrivibrio sp. YE44]|uniref:hypothetical protein n=1 Tax=Pseudobutyrivibrio sp. YE44 TaxID=1520802 RepID=UPI0008864002|nr:hypothetical protein [Pseudobutyrivibrio sp. YE44]SDB51919.1 hypothetical protein SAMN02910298_02655 [Pseudobutyrivibrio sp. YE44]
MCDVNPTLAATEQDETYVAINFDGVTTLATEMETIATEAQTLQTGLEEILPEIQNNWQDESAIYLRSHYEEFVSNIQTIVADITSVKEWAEQTSALFNAQVQQNQENIQNVLGQ